MRYTYKGEANIFEGLVVGACYDLKINIEKAGTVGARPTVLAPIKKAYKSFYEFSQDWKTV